MVETGRIFPLFAGCCVSEEEKDWRETPYAHTEYICGIAPIFWGSLRSMRYLNFRRGLASIDYLVSSIPKPREVPRAHKPKKAVPKGTPPADLLSHVISPIHLNERYRHLEYGAPTTSLLTKAANFFYNAEPKHEWTKAEYLEIPDVKVKLLDQKRKEKYENLDPLEMTEHQRQMVNSKTSYGIPPDVLRPLPEVLMLGHTNAGKSTLINRIFLDRERAKNQKSETEHAFVSARAGFTQCLVSFNVNNKLRIVDSPGYGFFGKEKQGQLVLEYIQKRQQLRRVFVLVDSCVGFVEEDVALLDFLVEHGVPFEIVFTKVDKVIAAQFPKISVHNEKADVEGRVAAYEGVQEGNAKVEAYFDKLIAEAGLKDLVTLPKLLFNNSRHNKLLEKRHGFNHIRYAILESCGLLESPPAPAPEEDTMVQENRGRRKRATRRLKIKA